ncbi:MAG: XRE family transcriptional regulator [Rhodospirillales bacterium]|nr:XRE family transcriptional regulator [Rhodospirillales bacterium]
MATRRARDDKSKPVRRGGQDPIDAHVGGRLRLRRMLLGMSQYDIGQAMGLTFQQIQKYERGKSRIGAGRLYEFARVLNVPVSFFFDDLAGDGAAGSHDDAAPVETEGRRDRQLLELMRAYRRILDPDVRRTLFELAKSLASRSSSAHDSKD